MKEKSHKDKTLISLMGGEDINPKQAISFIKENSKMENTMDLDSLETQRSIFIILDSSKMTKSTVKGLRLSWKLKKRR